jgi:IS1 family transposase
MANVLKPEKRAAVVKCLVEGMSIRGTVRVTSVAKNTVTKLLVDLGSACSEYQDEIMQNLPCQRLQCDEIWSFCYAKQNNVPEEYQGESGYGDLWTWVALDADTKLVPLFMVGDRSYADAYYFIQDLAARLANRIQLTTDRLKVYADAVEDAFGSEIDYAQLHKIYRATSKPDETRYSPAKCVGVDQRVVQGRPNPKHISTSYIERQKLTMRMGMRRFTRLTNAFSKKAENLAAAVALHFMHYNFARPHKSLSTPYPTTPAMAAGITDHVWTVEEIVGLLGTARQAQSN